MKSLTILQELSKKKIAIGILARDCGQAILTNIPKIEELGAYFCDYKVFVLENDSKDNTKDVLCKWTRQNANVHISMSDTGTVTIPKKTVSTRYPGASTYRIQKMADLRENLLKFIKDGYSPDYCMFIDIDIEDFSVEGIVKSIVEAPADWGGLFANGSHTRLDDNGQRVHIPFQYDYFAYISENSSPEDTFDRKFFSHWYMPYVEWKLNKMVSKTNYLKCKSAFNGIGIYKWACIQDKHYHTYATPELEKENCTLCEHIPFNLSIVDKGFSNYICRDILVDYGNRPHWDDNSYFYKHFPALYGIYKMCFKYYLHYLPNLILNNK